MRIIEQIVIKKFRGLENVSIKFNKPVNAIIGKNGAMKTTLLGMLAHPFTLRTGSMSSEQPLIGGKEFNSPVTCPAKREKTLKYALQTVKNRPSGLLFSQNTLNLSQNKSKVFNAS